MDEEPGTDQIGEQPGPNLTDNEQPIQTVPDLTSPTPPTPEPSPAAPPAPVVSPDAPPLAGPDTPPTTAGFEPPAITPSDQVPAQTPPPQSVSPVHPQSSFPTSSDEAPKGFNWGAFWYTWVWGIGHGIWISLLVILLDIILLPVVFSGSLLSSIINLVFDTTFTKGLLWVTWAVGNLIFLSINLLFGFKGNKWAWNRKKEVGVEAFRHGEKIWSIVGWIILGVPAIFGLIVSVFSLAMGKTSTECSPGVSIKIGGVEQCTNNTTPSGSADTTSSTNSAKTPAAPGETALGTAAQSGNFSVKVTGTKLDPPTTGTMENTPGDAPDPGTQYLEIDLAITNVGSENDMITSRSFVYKTSSGKELPNATTIVGTDTSQEGKMDLELAGKKRFVMSSIPAGATDNQVYMIYQIPKGDEGKLIWHDEHSFADPSPILATFLLK